MSEKLYFELPTDKGDLVIPEYSPINYEVEVDVYQWNINEAVVIIVGKWWTTTWYLNKYVSIATNLVDTYWVNVFVVGNPWISWDDPELFMDCAIKFIEDKMCDFWFQNFGMKIMWFSAWWHFTWRFAYKYPEIHAILLINPVLRQNFEELKEGLNSFEDKITIVQWNKDVDFPFNSLLSQISKAKLVVLDGVDHQFTHEWGLDLFISLPEKYLFT